MVLFLRDVLRKHLDDLVQEVAGAGTVGRGDGPDLAEAQAVEVVRVVHLLTRVDLVHAQDDGFLGTAQEVRDLRVIIGDAGLRLAHEQDHIGLFHGDDHLAADSVLEDIVRIGRITAGVHHRELGAAPFALAVMAVAGHARRLIDDGLTHAHQAVEKGRFAHVRASNYCN